jgi:endonuclease YncB( thermonuclease family)
MQSKIRRKTAPVRPSRIRRDPVRVPTEAELKQAEAAKRDREMRGGVAGIALFAAAIAAVIVGVGAATYSKFDPAAAEAEAARFRQCYTGVGANCVLDGDTITIQREQFAIAGIEAPAIQGAACGEERIRGIDSAVRLENLLNSGRVMASAAFADQYGRTVRTVEVDGKDVAKVMIAAGVAKPYLGEKRDWCARAG